MKSHSFPADFLADWFTKLLQIVERDCGSDLWQSIVAVCEHHPQTATDVIWRLTQPPEPIRLNIAGVMLGSLRHLPLDERQVPEYRRLEGFFERHTDEKFRAVYNWSWARTVRRIGISEPELHGLLTRADIGTAADLDSIVRVACCICINEKVPTEIFDQCFNWIEKRVDPSLPETAKYQIAQSAMFLSRTATDLRSSERDVTSWITGIQPVSEESHATWGEIEMFLNRLLATNIDSFQSVFEELCRTSANTIHHLMKEIRSFGSLLNRLQEVDVSQLVGRLAASIHTPTRQLGLFLFDRLNIEEIPDVAFQATGEIGVKVVFYETQRTFFDGQTLGKILVSLLRHANQCCEEFKTALLDEIILQARNFSGGCREELAARGGDIPEIRESLAAVEDYFQKLKIAHEGGVNMMAVAGHQRASQLYRRRLSLQVSDSAMKHSPLLKMVKQVSVLYGNCTSRFAEGILHEAMPMASSSTSLEVPIIDFCDPEEMAMRRIHASAAIQSLLNGVSAELGEEVDE